MATTRAQPKTLSPKEIVLLTETARQRGVQKIVYQRKSGMLVIEIWISPDFYDPALGAAPGREAVERWLAGTTEKYLLEWWRTDTGEGPFPEP